jgi:hypothetical protein
VDVKVLSALLSFVAMVVAAVFGGMVAFAIVGAISGMVLLIVGALFSSTEVSADEIKEMLSRPEYEYAQISIRSIGWNERQFIRDGGEIGRWRDDLIVGGKEHSIRETGDVIILTSDGVRVATASPSKGKGGSYLMGYKDGAFRLEMFGDKNRPWAMRRDGRIVGFDDDYKIVFAIDIPPEIAVFCHIVVSKYQYKHPDAT